MAFLDETGLAELWSLVREADVKIAVGSYTGAGYAGPNYKNSLTFDFEPKLVIVMDQSELTGWQYIFVNGKTKVQCVPEASYAATVSWSDNTVTWWMADASSSSNATNSGYVKHQFNTSGATYHYFAIG